MAGRGQLDVGRLASDLGLREGHGLDLGQVARSLTSGGSHASRIAAALGRQGGDLAGLLRSPAGLALGGAALAAAGIGAGMLLSRAQQGQATAGGGIAGALGNLMQGGTASIGDGLGALFGGSHGTPSREEGARARELAEQLPAARPEELREGQTVLARWEGDEWRTGQVGWVDGGRARVTFDNGFERWCDPADIRLPPRAGDAATPSEHASSAGPAAPTVGPGEPVSAMWGPDEFRPAQALEVDSATRRVRVRYENGFEVWLEPHQIRKPG
jgi:hypothetical protein